MKYAQIMPAGKPNQVILEAKRSPDSPQPDEWGFPFQAQIKHDFTLCIKTNPFLSKQ